MATGFYPVIDGKTRKAKANYAVVGGVTKKIARMYAVVDGKTRLIWSSMSGGKAYILNLDYITKGIIYSFDKDMSTSGQSITSYYLQYATLNEDNTIINKGISSDPGSIKSKEMCLSGKYSLDIATTSKLYKWDETQGKHVLVQSIKLSDQIKALSPFSSASSFQLTDCVWSADGSRVLINVKFFTSSNKAMSGCGIIMYKVENDQLVLEKNYGLVYAPNTPYQASDVYFDVTATPDLSMLYINGYCNNSYSEKTRWYKDLFYLNDDTCTQITTTPTSGYSKGYTDGFFTCDGKYLIAMEGSSNKYKLYHIINNVITDLGYLRTGTELSAYITYVKNYTYNPETEVLMIYGTGTSTYYHYFFQLSENGSTILGRFSDDYYDIVDETYDGNYVLTSSLHHCESSRNNLGVITSIDSCTGLPSMGGISVNWGRYLRP